MLCSCKTQWYSQSSSYLTSQLNSKLLNTPFFGKCSHPLASINHTLLIFLILLQPLLFSSLSKHTSQNVASHYRLSPWTISSASLILITSVILWRISDLYIYTKPASIPRNVDAIQRMEIQQGTKQFSSSLSSSSSWMSQRHFQLKVSKAKTNIWSP